jgi:hypothetical protein
MVRGLDARPLPLQWQAGENKEILCRVVQADYLVMGEKKKGMTCGFHSKDNC